ncbi:histidinol-phosphate/aromatic aminotransferase/cobyric acid decarboxylase-like protein [Arthrobacter sp. B3I9]|nr:histidinol-phosphate/aromatic aminotransferase/cobyric acid decarboxylase-like protein [Arthrobacter sp. B3I9]
MTDQLERLNRLPLRTNLRGMSPYGAPQLDVPILLNVNENTHGVPADVRAAISAAVTEAAAGLNRYPDREFTELREALAEYLGHGLGPENIWAANGSNEVLQQILQAFGGPGRTALSFPPTYSMYPLLAAGTDTEYIVGLRADSYGLTAESAARQIRETQANIVFPLLPEQSHRHGPGPGRRGGRI